MLIGYARVSTQEQDTQSQISALESAGCELILLTTRLRCFADCSGAGRCMGSALGK